MTTQRAWIDGLGDIVVHRYRQYVHPDLGPIVYDRAFRMRPAAFQVRCLVHGARIAEERDVLFERKEKSQC